MKYFSLFFSLLLIFAIGFGQVPRKLSYQGLLTDSTGVPLPNGPYDLTFKIYNLPTGGTLRHTETFASVPLENGTFSVTLGSIAELSTSFTEALYVEVTVDNGPASVAYPVLFSSRTELTAAPYALGPWSPNPSSVSYNGKVGIGTVNPESQLHVTGSQNEVLNVESSSGNGTWLSVNNTSSGGTKFSIISTGESNSEGAGKLLFNGSSRQMVLDNSGRLGVATTSPTQELDVNGTTKTINLQVTDGAMSDYILRSDSSGNASWVSPSIIATSADTMNIISDADRNTKIEAGQSTSDDKIHFTLGGTEYFKMNKATLEFNNAGGSVFIGSSAGSSDDYSGRHNTVIGSNALQYNTSGNNHVAIGRRALQNHTSGNENVAIGVDALRDATSANSTTAVGNAAGYGATGDF
ncbi:MAG: hypothetical protein HYZ34_04895, partial [Ignavibacteriae bacterium]|nr:hypothetical protein [Ignavibacteriota bacterium]